jgi:hypothetical protein
MHDGHKNEREANTTKTIAEQKCHAYVRAYYQRLSTARAPEVKTPHAAEVSPLGEV